MALTSVERSYKNAIQTFSGREFWPLNPEPEDIYIEDIAHALSLQCRFGGHSKKHYSIAQHSVLVSRYSNKEDALSGLAHDFSEAYIADICSPVKRHLDFQFYRDAEYKLMHAISRRFGLPQQQPESVTLADELVLAAEVRDLMTPILPFPHWKCRKLDVTFIPKIDPWPPEESEKRLLEEFYKLGGK